MLRCRINAAFRESSERRIYAATAPEKLCPAPSFCSFKIVSWPGLVHLMEKGDGIMKAGIFTAILGSLNLEQTLDYAASLGAQAVEFGAGAYASSTHCDVDALLASDRKAKELRSAVTSRGLHISALNCAGNPLHPDKKRARADDVAFRK